MIHENDDEGSQSSCEENRRTAGRISWPPPCTIDEIIHKLPSKWNQEVVFKFN